MSDEKDDEARYEGLLDLVTSHAQRVRAKVPELNVRLFAAMMYYHCTLMVELGESRARVEQRLDAMYRHEDQELWENFLRAKAVLPKTPACVAGAISTLSFLLWTPACALARLANAVWEQLNGKLAEVVAREQATPEQCQRFYDAAITQVLEGMAKSAISAVRGLEEAQVMFAVDDSDSAREEWMYMLAVRSMQHAGISKPTNTAMEDVLGRIERLYHGLQQMYGNDKAREAVEKLMIGASSLAKAEVGKVEAILKSLTKGEEFIN